MIRLLVLLATIAAAGCVCSNRVSNLGQRFYLISGVVSESERQIVVGIDEYEAVTPDEHEHAVPYTHELTLGRRLGSHQGVIDRSSYKNHPGNAAVVVRFGGGDHVFVVPGGGTEPRPLAGGVMAGRTWWFLPAQGLQVLAVPADIAIDAVLTALILGAH